MNKKIIAAILCLTSILTVFGFTACSKQEQKKETTSVTQEAKIKDADAITYIQSYSDEELGLTTEEHAKCSFMVASDSEKIDGKDYVKVIAAIKKPHKADDGQITYTFDTKGEYFISFNGDEVLKKSGDTYSKMKVITTTAKENK